MLFELRQYHIRPGQRDNWVKCMEEAIIPLGQDGHGDPGPSGAERPS